MLCAATARASSRSEGRRSEEERKGKRKGIRQTQEFINNQSPQVTQEIKEAQAISFCKCRVLCVVV